MKVLYHLVFIVVLCTNVHAQPLNHKARMDTMWNDLHDSTFFELLDKEKLKLTIPLNFYNVPVVKNYDIFYQYALASKEDSFEVRFLLRQIDIQQYDTSKVDVDNFCYSLMNIAAMNAAGGNFAKLPEIEILSNYDSLDLNVEWKARARFSPVSDFGKEYTVCILYVRRINQDILLYYFLLFTDMEQQKELEKKALYCISNK